MTVLQMLAKVICTEELLGLVAFTEFVHMIQMFRPRIPICRIRKLFTTVSTNVRHC